MGKTHIASDETLRRIAIALEGMGAATVPEFDSATGRYDNASIKSWLARMRDGKNYGVSIPKGNAVACTKTGANAGIANPVPGVIGRAAVDPYRGLGPFNYFEVNGGVDADGTPYVTAIQGDGQFTRTNDTWIMTPTIYYIETETDSAVSLSVSDTQNPGMSPVPGAKLPDGSIRPYMLYAKYALSTDSAGNPHTVTGQPVKRFISHDSGPSLCKTSTTGYSLRNSADDWYVKAMYLLKYATKNSQSVFAGCTGHTEQTNPTVEESGVTRVIVAKSIADVIPVGSSMQFGTHTTTSTDRGDGKTYDIFAAAKVIRKVAVDASNTALYFDVAKAFDTKKTYLLSTTPWNTGACDAVDGDGSPSSCTDGRQPFTVQGIELGLGMYEIIGNVMLTSSGSGWKIKVNPDSKNERTGSSPDSALDGGAFPGPSGEGWNYGLYPKTVNGLMMQQGTGASTSVGICDGNYKNSDATTGWREFLALGGLGGGGIAGLFCVVGSSGSGSAWWHIGSRLSANGRQKG